MNTSRIQNSFLSLISLVYFWAFLSLYHQIPGLYGDEGLLPVSTAPRCTDGLARCLISGKPSGNFFLADALGLSPAEGLEAVTLVGASLAALAFVFASFRDCFVFFAMWYFYLSCCQVGRTFLWFQWDVLLLEAGFLAAVAAPMRAWRGDSSAPHDAAALFLVRWLALRLMFASGVVKLTSECPTWWRLTALHHHFETQCIPTAAAWWAHQSADWLKRLSVAATYIIEILVPPLFLLPLRQVRVVAFWSQVLLMGLIVLTGNYNFFNVATIALCLPLLVSSEASAVSTDRFKNVIGDRMFTLARAAMIGGCYGAIIYWSVYLFGFRLVTDKAGWPMVVSKLQFSKNEFYRALGVAVPYMITAGCVAFAAEVAAAMCRCFTDFPRSSVFGRLCKAFQCLICCSVFSLLFAISLVPFAHLHSSADRVVWPEVKRWHAQTDHLRLSSSYGLFRMMTGVGGRPEVVVEGADSPTAEWREYDFLYKPGALDRAPPFIVPHQARLDWQMWFAALGSFEHNPWFISMVHRLLQGQPEVLRLIAKAPYGRPPKFIRAQLYLYHFSSANDSDRNWWRREWSREYMPPISLQHQNLIDYLTNAGLIVPKTKEVKGNQGLARRALEGFRSVAEQTTATGFVWATTLALFIGRASFNRVVDKMSTASG